MDLNELRDNVNTTYMTAALTILDQLHQIAGRSIFFHLIKQYNHPQYHRSQLGLTFVIDCDGNCIEEYYAILSEVLTTGYRITHEDGLIVVECTTDIDALCKNCCARHE